MYRSVYRKIKGFIKVFVDPDKLFLAHLRSLGAKVGDDVQIVDRFKFKFEPWNADLLDISDGVVIAEGVQLVTHDSSYANIFSDLPSRMGAIKLGKNTYIGINSIILPGVTIGECSLIGAGSVVTKNIPAYSLVAGNPAKVIGSSLDGLARYKIRIDTPRGPEFFVDFGGAYKQIREKHGNRTSDAIVEIYRNYRKYHLNTQISISTSNLEKL